MDIRKSSVDSVDDGSTCTVHDRGIDFVQSKLASVKPATGLDRLLLNAVIFNI